MNITIELTRDIAACRALRAVVFIDEQGVSLADEIDDLDEVSHHLIARNDAQDVGTARITIIGDTAKIGRVCVVQSHRGTGLGAALIQRAVEISEAQGARQAKLSAQEYALGFYARLGFCAVGSVFDDAGIPHRDMTRDL